MSKPSLAMAYGMARKKKMAEGGEMASGYLPEPLEHPAMNEMALSEDDKNINQTADMVARIMAKRQAYSEGGMVANDTPPMADSEPADYDDLALDDHLEGKDSGSDEGDDLGNQQEAEDRADIVSRIMRSRSKKDRMPRPA